MAVTIDKIVYYELVKKELILHPDAIVTAAIWSCALCGDTISGMGGPGYDEICEKCGDDIIHKRIRYFRERDTL